MVLGNDFSPYLDHKLGGPFLNFHLTENYLQSEKSLEQKAQIFKKLSQQRADVILDQEGIFEELLIDLPALKELYKSSQPGVFVKASN
jgi:hypothetical protein